MLTVKLSEKDLFSPIKLIEKALESDLDLDVGAVSEERDFRVAANVVEFLTDPYFIPLRPFPRQIQVAMHAFMDFCPLCSNPRYVDNLYDQSLDDILDNIVFLKYGVCPRCGLSRAHLVESGLFKGWINEVVGVAGQRSSKSFTVAALSLYLLHRYLMLPTIPYRFFGLAPTLLHMTFVALTYKQAEDNLWDPFLNFYTGSKWFQEYNAMLREKGNELGVSLVDVRNTYILYRHKNITVYPSGPDKRKLRGRTRFGYSIDEFSYFDSSPSSKSIKFSASEIYQALENSLATVRAAVAAKRREGYYDIPDAYSFLISSPVSKNDKLMLMLRSADRVPSRYAFHYATWEFNPRISFDDLKEYFEKDPVKARRDFGADPPLNDTPLVSNAGIVRRALGRIPGRTNLFVVRQVHDGGYVYANVRLRRKVKRPVVIGLDAGLTNNSFSLAVLSIGEKRFYVDGVVEVIPLDGVVNFARMGQVLKKICRYLKPIMVCADRWNSVTMLHELEEEDLTQHVSQFTLSYRDLRDFAGGLITGSLGLPELEKGVRFETIVEADFEYPHFFVNRPVAHLTYQFLTVRDTGRRVDKGLNATDDLFRAVAVAYHGARTVLESEEVRSLLGAAEEGEDEAAATLSTASLGYVPKRGSLSRRTDAGLGVVRTFSNAIRRSYRG